MKQVKYNGSVPLKIKRSVAKKKKDKTIKCYTLYSKKSVVSSEGKIIGDMDENQNIPDSKKKKHHGLVCGYIYVGQNKWVAYHKTLTKSILTIAAPIVVTGALITGMICFNQYHKNNDSIDYDNTINISDILPATKEQLTEETIDFTVQPNYKVSAANKNIYLKNPKSNTVSMKYTVCDTATDTILLTTKWIKPGDAYPWNVKDDTDINQGSTTVYFKIETIDVKLLVSCTSQTIKDVKIMKQ